jgi:hypothetical protein
MDQTKGLGDGDAEASKVFVGGKREPCTKAPIENPVPIAEADDERLAAIADGLDQIIAIAVSAKREVRYRDVEALRGALSVLRLLASDCVREFLALGDPEKGS